MKKEKRDCQISFLESNINSIKGFPNLSSFPHLISLVTALNKTHRVSLRSLKRASDLSFQSDEDSIYIFFGISEDLDEILKKIPKGMPTVFIEKDIVTFSRVMNEKDLERYLKERPVYFIVAKPKSEVIKRVIRLLLLYGRRRMKILHITKDGYMDSLSKELLSFEKSGIFSSFKIDKSRKRVLVIYAENYALYKEVIAAFKKIGFEIINVEFDPQGSNDRFIGKMVEVIGKFSPNFIFTINHVGFDRYGFLGGVIRTFGVPYVCWYIDSPKAISMNPEVCAKELATIFVWDGAYIEYLKKLGFENVYKLPLATSLDIFDLPYNRPKTEVISFVGSSLFFTIEKWEKMMSHWITKRSLLEDEDSSWDKVAKKNAKEMLEIWRSSQRKRFEILSQLMDFPLYIYGDPGWRRVFKNGVRIFGPLNYYRDLKFVYQSSLINLNISNDQLIEALNQRVFDIPVCGGFVITDKKKDLFELFDIKEKFWFSSKEDLLDLVHFAMKNEAYRKRVTECLRAQVIKRHTYTFRVKEMLEKLKGVF